VKVKQWCIFLIILFLTNSSFGACPPGVQETVIFFLNGINNTASNISESRDKLEEELIKDPSYHTDCIKILAAKNPDGSILNADALGDNYLEVFLQKTNEWQIPLQDAMSMLYGFTEPAQWFLDLTREENVKFNDIAQTATAVIQEHLSAYRQELNAGKKVILVSHSQGGFFANAEWNSLTKKEQDKTSIVTVATPSSYVADGGESRNTKVDPIVQTNYRLV
jgi:hypothetical protein